VNPPRYPAAYLRSGSEFGEMTMNRAAAELGWPEPDLYADLPGSSAPGAALQELTDAIAAGRHDGLLLPTPRSGEAAIWRLLASCARTGVAVSFILSADDSGRRQGLASGRTARGKSGEPAGTLMSASLEALGQVFPTWRIWHDRHGWHARRREGHIQLFRPGAPAFYVRAGDATSLAAQLCWQQAAETYTPDGCAQGRLAEESGLQIAAGAGHGR
jgi:hypothetical protein